MTTRPFAPLPPSRTVPRGVGWWLIAALFLAALLFQLVVIRRALGAYDESLELYCADHALRGEVPYRDFYTLYSPGQFYVLAIFFKLFGTSALVARFYDALIRAGLGCTCFVIVHALAGRRVAMFAFAAVLLWLTCNNYPIYNLPIFPALLCSLLSLLFFSRYLSDASGLASVFVAGILVGATAAFRHDLGFYICFAEVATVLWATLSYRQAGLSAMGALSDRSRAAMLYLAGILLIALPVILLLLWKVPTHDLFYDLFYVPSKIYPKFRNMPFQSVRELRYLLRPLSPAYQYSAEEWIVIFPVFVCLTGCSAALYCRRSSTPLFENPFQRYTFALLLLLCPLFFLKGIIRVSEIQQIQSIVVSIVLFAILLGRLPQLHSRFIVPLVVCGLYLLDCSTPLLLHAVLTARTNWTSLVEPASPNSLKNTCHPPPGLERARCMIIEPQAIAAIQYVQQRTTATDRIFVGAGRHDKVLWNDVRLYFVANRPSITKWYYFDPGVQTTLPIQNEIIASMRQYSPKLIVLDSSADDRKEPNASQYSSGVTVLDDYIRSHYSAQATFGSETILAPNR